jgi:predicted nucleic acid-binding protein
MVYADSSFIIAVYLPEAGSAQAIKWMSGPQAPLPFTPLHRHEIRTGIRQRVFRGEITPSQLAAALAEIDADLESDVLNHAPIPWTDSFREAERLSAARATEIQMRSLDLLHVGIALALNAKTFLTFDIRQREIAKAAGLRVKF